MRFVTVADAVDVAHLPADTTAVLAYVDGHWQTVAAARRRFPKATVVPITVTGSLHAPVVDCERGNLSPASAAAWVRRQRARGLLRPCVYVALGEVPELLVELERVGLHRRDVRLWTAHWTFSPHRCSGRRCGLAGGSSAGATQYAGGPLRKYDLSVTTGPWLHSLLADWAELAGSSASS